MPTAFYNLPSQFQTGIKVLMGLILTLSQLSCGDENSNSVDNIESTEKLLGLSFEPHERDSMLNYLERNRGGYDSMRTRPLDYSVAPPIFFDPRPDELLDINSNTEGPDILNIPGVESLQIPENDTDIAFLTVNQLSYLIRTGQLTSTALTEIYLKRLKFYGDTIEAVVTLTEDIALRQAARADEEIAAGKYRGFLHGIPYGVKDLLAVPGYPTTWGAEPYRDQVINETAFVVRQLEDAGAVLVAKLTSGSLARGDVWYGGKTRSPWDLDQGASGSSAGSASATAAGLVAFAIGTETLGSIISPSTRCGVTGLRPSFGAVSRSGCMSLSWSLDKIGPIARSAVDCAIVFSAIKGADPQDRTSADFPFQFDPKASLGDYKIAYFKGLFDNDSSDAGSNNLVVLEQLRGLGADLKEVFIPKDHPFNAFDIILRAESGAYFDTLVLNHWDRLLVQQHTGSRANSLRQSRFIPAVEYLQAQRHRKILIEEFYRITKDYDVIISPTFGGRQLLITNLTGNPAISIPTGFDEEGHPTSITLIGNLYGESRILEVAFLFQQATNYEAVHPEFFLEDAALLSSDNTSN